MARRRGDRLDAPVPQHVLTYVDTVVLPRCRALAERNEQVIGSGDPDLTLLVLGLPARTEPVAEPKYIPREVDERRRPARPTPDLDMGSCRTRTARTIGEFDGAQVIPTMQKRITGPVSRAKNGRSRKKGPAQSLSGSGAGCE